MHHLTPSECFAGFLIASGAILFIAGGYCLHLKKIVQDILKNEKARLRAWAVKYAEQLARERLAELLRNVRINVPVTMINESDIDWGEAHEKQREDDAA